MSNDALLILHELACLALLYSVFCRASLSSRRVHLSIRLAFFVAGLAACIGIVAPVSFAWVPDPVSLILVVAFAVVQVTTGRYWDAGVPVLFCRELKNDT